MASGEELERSGDSNGGFEKAFLLPVGGMVQRKNHGLIDGHFVVAFPQVDEEKYKELEPLMGGILSRRSLRKAAYKSDCLEDCEASLSEGPTPPTHRYPTLLQMPASELAVRLVALKGLLAGCDVALLVGSLTHRAFGDAYGAF